MAETAQLEAAVKALSDIVKMNTVNDHEQLVADYLVALLKQHGIEAKTITYAPGRVNLVAEIGGWQRAGDWFGWPRRYGGVR